MVIATLLPLSDTFTQLALSSAGINAHGACVLAEGIRQATKLTDISLWDNNISCRGAAAVTDALIEAAEVRTMHGPRFGLTGYGHSLTALNLAGNGIGDEGVASLSRLIGRLPTLQSLDISHNDRITMAVGDTLSSALLKAYVRACVGAGGLSRFTFDWTCRAVHSYQDQDTEMNLVTLKLSRLNWFVPQYIGPASWKQGTYSFRRQHVNSAEVAVLATLLAQHPSCTDVNWERNALGPETGAWLAKILAAPFSEVALFRCRYNRLGSVGVAALATPLSTNTALIHLDLRACQCGDDGAIALLTVLRDHNRHLVRLLLSHNDLTEAVVPVLCGVVEHHPSLRQVTLSHNRIAPSRAHFADLGRALATNLDLQTLDLGNNPLGVEQCFALGDALARAAQAPVVEALGEHSDASLYLDLELPQRRMYALGLVLHGFPLPLCAVMNVHAIDLSGLYVHEHDLAFVIGALSNSVLPVQMLDLSLNVVTDSIGRLLCRMLRVNRQLEALKLQNLAHPGVAQWLLQGVAGNRKIGAIQLGKDTHPRVHAALSRALEANAAFTSLWSGSGHLIHGTRLYVNGDALVVEGGRRPDGSFASGIRDYSLTGEYHVSATGNPRWLLRQAVLATLTSWLILGMVSSVVVDFVLNGARSDVVAGSPSVGDVILWVAALVCGRMAGACLLWKGRQVGQRRQLLVAHLCGWSVVEQLLLIRPRPRSGAASSSAAPGQSHVSDPEAAGPVQADDASGEHPPATRLALAPIAVRGVDVREAIPALGYRGVQEAALAVMWTEAIPAAVFAMRHLLVALPAVVEDGGVVALPTGRVSCVFATLVTLCALVYATVTLVHDDYVAVDDAKLMASPERRGGEQGSSTKDTPATSDDALTTARSELPTSAPNEPLLTARSDTVDGDGDGSAKVETKEDPGTDHGGKDTEKGATQETSDDEDASELGKWSMRLFYTFRGAEVAMRCLLLAWILASPGLGTAVAIGLMVVVTAGCLRWSNTVTAVAYQCAQTRGRNSAGTKGCCCFPWPCGCCRTCCLATPTRRSSRVYDVSSLEDQQTAPSGTAPGDNGIMAHMLELASLRHMQDKGSNETEAWSLVTQYQRPSSVRDDVGAVQGTGAGARHDGCCARVQRVVRGPAVSALAPQLSAWLMALVAFPGYPITPCLWWRTKDKPGPAAVPWRPFGLFWCLVTTEVVFWGCWSAHGWYFRSQVGDLGLPEQSLMARLATTIAVGVLLLVRVVSAALYFNLTGAIVGALGQTAHGSLVPLRFLAAAANRTRQHLNEAYQKQLRRMAAPEIVSSEPDSEERALLKQTMGFYLDAFRTEERQTTAILDDAGAQRHAAKAQELLAGRAVAGARIDDQGGAQQALAGSTESATMTAHAPAPAPAHANDAGSVALMDGGASTASDNEGASTQPASSALAAEEEKGVEAQTSGHGGGVEADAVGASDELGAVGEASEWYDWDAEEAGEAAYSGAGAETGDGDHGDDGDDWGDNAGVSPSTYKVHAPAASYDLSLSHDLSENGPLLPATPASAARSPISRQSAAGGWQWSGRSWVWRGTWGDVESPGGVGGGVTATSDGADNGGELQTTSQLLSAAFGYDAGDDAVAANADGSNDSIPWENSAYQIVDNTPTYDWYQYEAAGTYVGYDAEQTQVEDGEVYSAQASRMDPTQTVPGSDSAPSDDDSPTSSDSDMECEGQAWMRYAASGYSIGAGRTSDGGIAPAASHHALVLENDEMSAPAPVTALRGGDAVAGIDVGEEYEFGRG